jgi:hypothetical protein
MQKPQVPMRCMVSTSPCRSSQPIGGGIAHDAGGCDLSDQGLELGLSFRRAPGDKVEHRGFRTAIVD